MSHSLKQIIRGEKILEEFRWIDPYIFEKVLPKNNDLVRKIGTNKTQVLDRMRMRQFTPQQPVPDIRIKPQKWKIDSEVSLKYDDLDGRAWECEKKAKFGRHPIHPKRRKSLIQQSRKRGTNQEPKESVPEKFFSFSVYVNFRIM